MLAKSSSMFPLFYNGFRLKLKVDDLHTCAGVVPIFFATSSFSIVPSCANLLSNSPSKIFLWGLLRLRFFPRTILQSIGRINETTKNGNGWAFIPAISKQCHKLAMIFSMKTPWHAIWHIILQKNSKQNMMLMSWPGWASQSVYMEKSWPG